jgi:centromere protein C
MRLPPPRAKTPIKTFLQSPARRNPSLGPNSSPARGSVELRNTSVTASVRRKLDFSSDNLEGNILESSATFGSPRKPGRLAPPMLLHSANDNGNNDQADTEPIEGYTGLDTAGDSFQMGGEADDDVEDEVEDVETEEAFEQDPDPEIEPQSAKQAKGKGKVTEFEVAKPPENRGRGRRPKDTQLIPVEEDTGEPPAKRTRRSLEGPTSAPQVEPKGKPGRPGRPSKHSKPTASKEPKSKALSKKPQLAPIAEAESPEAHRGPPLPRNNRGLMILRRETPMDSSGFKQTRSGRNSIKPLAYWRMERVEYSEDEMEDNHGKFLTSKIKSVVRVDEAEEKQKKKSYYKPSRGKKRSAAVESDDEVEPWETAPGHIFGPTRIWNPDDLTGVEASEHEDEIALSSAAIITRDVAGATFKFAKTLTLPFFGSGMVDLPAGTEKKMKNSRRMQMVFFVFYGRVDVTVNDTTFGIGKGGMWQVPRGNYTQNIPFLTSAY